MKKIITLVLALVFCLSFAACGNESDSSVPQKATSKDFPYCGTWVNSEGDCYVRIKEDGTTLEERIMTSSTTTTTNGVANSFVKRTMQTTPGTWSLNKKNLLIDGMWEYTPSIENDQYYLSVEAFGVRLSRVGDSNYKIPVTIGEERVGLKAAKEDAQKYTLGTVLSAEGIEMTFEECGVGEDIRISHKSGNTTYTTGPTVEDGMQYVYLKGTLKNTGHAPYKCIFAGMVFLDDYEFNFERHLVTPGAHYAYELAPLETVNVLLCSQISDEMAGKFSKGKIVFAFNDNFADVELGSSQYLYYATVTK